MKGCKMAAQSTEGMLSAGPNTWAGELLDGLGAVVRYVWPGFVALFAWIAVGRDSCPGPSRGGYATWGMVGASVLIGVLIYAVHVCFVGRLILRPLILLIHLGKADHPWISASQRRLAKQGTARLLLELAVGRLRRRISQDAETRAVQRSLDRWRGMLNLLYCSGYALMIVLLLAQCPESAVKEGARAEYVLILGIVLLVVGLISDCACTWRELWAAATYRTSGGERRRSRRS